MSQDEYMRGVSDGIRFVLENFESYRVSKGEEITQFGDFQMHMEEKTGLPPKSKEHLERRILSIISLFRPPASAEKGGAA